MLSSPPTSARQVDRRLLAFAVVIAVVVFGAAAPAPSWAADQERMRLAVEHLLAAQLPSGLFSYDFDFLEGKPKEPNNIAREAATAYFLAEYYLHVRDDRVRRAIEAALTRLGALSLPIRKSPLQSLLEHTGLLSLPVGRYKLRAALDGLHLLYRPDGDGKVVSADNSYANAWAGATPIALLAELQYHRATADSRFAGLRAAWLKGLRALHVPARGFRAFPNSIDDSPYVDGQGWLVLAHYAGTFPLDDNLAALLKSLDEYLMRRYGRDFSFQFYHWGTMAAAVRWEQTSDQRFMRFIRMQALLVLDRPEWRRARLDNTCAPLEGLATAAAVLREWDVTEAALLRRIHERIDAEMAKNRDLQIQPNRDRLRFAEGTYLSSPRLRDFSGAFLAGTFSPYTRIDITGHCLSAMVKLRD